MQWDGEEPGKRARHRDEALRGYVRRELGPFSPFYRRHFREAGIDPARVRGLADLSRLPPVQWSEVGEEPRAFVLRPRRRDLARRGDRGMVLSFLAGRLTGRLDRVNRSVVEPRYKPVLWLVEDGVPIGYTDADLELLAEAGARVLALAGLDRRDVLVGLTEAGPSLAHWQLVLGAREAGVASLHLGPRPHPEAVAAARPTVLAGPPEALLRVLAGVAGAGGVLSLDRLHTLLVTGTDPDPGTRDALGLAAAAARAAPSSGETVAPEAPAVVASWAPRGVRAQWGECRAGAGFHTFPDLEILEVERDGGLHTSGEGELVWSGLGWRGTALFRLLTGTLASLADGTCTACGRKGPMVLTGSRTPLRAVGVLGGRDEVAAFQVEFGRRDGADEMLVFLALEQDVDIVDLLSEVDDALSAVQYVVLPRRQVEARVRQAGARVVSTR